MKLVTGIILLIATCTASQAEDGAMRALLRIERIQPTEAVCALVQEDGNYRLEKVFYAKTQVYLGALDPANLQQIKSLLANTQLQQLSQSDISRALVSDTLDSVQIVIWRSRGLQLLSYPAPETRKPHREMIEPLVRWLHNLQKEHPGAARADVPPNRCVPQRIKVLVQQEETTSLSRPEGEIGTRKRDEYLFRFHSSHYYNRLAESTCTIVFADGAFHTESSHQRYLGKHENESFDGQVSGQRLETLRLILDSSDLKGSPSNPDSEDFPAFREGTFASVTIPRSDALQNLWFSTAFETRGDPSEVGGMSGMGYRVANQKLLEPLKKWMKENTKVPRDGVQTAAMVNGCAPSKRAPAARNDSK